MVFKGAKMPQVIYQRKNILRYKTMENAKFCIYLPTGNI